MQLLIIPIYQIILNKKMNPRNMQMSKCANLQMDGSEAKKGCDSQKEIAMGMG